MNKMIIINIILYYSYLIADTVVVAVVNEAEAAVVAAAVAEVVEAIVATKASWLLVRPAMMANHSD